MSKLRGHIKTGLLIVLGSAVYSAATHFFIFPKGILLGGTSGVSVILNHFFPSFSSGEFLMIINILLMIAALLILGKSMAIKTMIGSLLTTLFIGLLDSRAGLAAPIVESTVLSAIIGATIVAIGSAILFYIDSSSGGTDIIALIIRKFSRCNIGKALLLADFLIVLGGAVISDLETAIVSVLGVLIKTLGIDLLIKLIGRLRTTGNEK